MSGLLLHFQVHLIMLAPALQEIFYTPRWSKAAFAVTVTKAAFCLVPMHFGLPKQVLV